MSLYVPTYSEALQVSRTRGQDSVAPYLWDGLVGFWPTLQGGGKTLYDLSGKDNHGTLTNMDPVTAWVAGDSRVGEMALEYDDASLDYVNTEINAFELGIRRNATFSAWINTPVLGSLRTVVADWLGNLGFSIRVGSSEEITFFVYPGDYRINTSSTITAGEWNHVVGLMAGTDMYVYINGVESGTTALGGDIGGSGRSTRIGARGDGKFFFKGQIANVCIHNRTLASSEIQLLYERPNILLESRRSVFPVAVPVLGFGGINRIIGGGLVA